MLIAIEGVMGVGKSTLQQQLVAHYAAASLVQEWERHPLVAQAHADPARYAPENLMIFLYMGYHQLRADQPWPVLTISDFCFEKSLIVGTVTVAAEDYHGLVVPTHTYLRPRVRQPDLIVYLAANPTLILARIRQRSRTMEAPIPTERIARLAQAYDTFWEGYQGCPVLTVRAETCDVVGRPGDLRALTHQIEVLLPTLTPHP